ncbi:MAG: TetR/AcrR family transcriptional regulator [Spirochaetales bacterium]|nr:TetR/AcrR family transcriptional regulator [Spirochaetales bacterium]
MSREDTIFGDDWPYSKAKSALLRSAATVIREQGPRSATLKNIAAKAGVTEPAIFRHFDGVDGVFQSLFSVVELFYGRFVQLFKDEESTGLDRLEAGSAKLFATIKDNADFAYIMAKPDPVFRQYPKMHSRMQELDAQFRAVIVESLKGARSGGQLIAGVDLESTATAVIGVIFQVMYAWLENVDGMDPRKEGKKALGSLLSLCRKPGTESKVIKPKATRKKS